MGPQALQVLTDWLLLGLERTVLTGKRLAVETCKQCKVVCELTKTFHLSWCICWRLLLKERDACQIVTRKSHFLYGLKITQFLISDLVAPVFGWSHSTYSYHKPSWSTDGVWTPLNLFILAAKYPLTMCSRSIETFVVWKCTACPTGNQSAGTQVGNCVIFSSWKKLTFLQEQLGMYTQPCRRDVNSEAD